MTLETEAVIDRRRLRRRMSLWRGLAVLALALALGTLGVTVSGVGSDGGSIIGRHQIARVSIEGLITEDRDQLTLLRKLGENKSVEAVILYVNSPGGTTTGGEALFGAIRELSNKKPVVAQFGTIATSAAYIAGLGTDYIFARGNTITGSVGVIFQWAEVTELMGKLGVKMNEIKSGPLKAVPSPFQPLNEAGRQTTERMVAESMGWFRGLVAERRKVDTAAIPGLEQGRIFSGREAIEHKLIDSIGGEPEVVTWLTSTRGVTKGLKVVDWKPKRAESLGLLGMAGRALGLLEGDGRSWTAALLGDNTGLAGLGLGGLVSIWQPAER
ncbi:MAG: signal peptide peptidase SppA [Hyphomicrobiaceae bacterium]|nr:signal peptide peptidase SppA [Hyphomicrobiaceae bacterium]